MLEISLANLPTTGFEGQGSFTQAAYDLVLLGKNTYLLFVCDACAYFAQLKLSLVHVRWLANR